MSGLLSLSSLDDEVLDDVFILLAKSIEEKVFSCKSSHSPVNDTEICSMIDEHLGSIEQTIASSDESLSMEEVHRCSARDAMNSAHCAPQTSYCAQNE